MSDKVMNPNSFADVQDLPPDAVGLLVWRVPTEYGPQPLMLAVSRASYDRNRKRLMNRSMQFDPDETYYFESPTNSKGRKSEFFISRVVAWAANLDTGIVPVKA